MMKCPEAKKFQNAQSCADGRSEIFSLTQHIAFSGRPARPNQRRGSLGKAAARMKKTTGRQP